MILGESLVLFKLLSLTSLMGISSTFSTVAKLRRCYKSWKTEQILVVFFCSFIYMFTQHIY